MFRFVANLIENRRSRPKDYGFDLTDDIFEIFVAVAWAKEPVERLRVEVAKRRRNEKWRSLALNATGLIVGVWIVLAVYYFQSGEVLASDKLPTISRVFVMLAILSAVANIFGFYISWRYDRRNALIRILLNVIRKCESIRKNEFDYELRAALASMLDAAAAVFFKIYRKPVRTASRLHLKQRRQLARQGSQAILAIESECMGSLKNICEVRDDSARVVLRVAAGDWMAVSQLRDISPSVRLRPSLSTRLSENAENKLLVAFLALCTAAVYAAVKFRN